MKQIAELRMLEGLQERCTLLDAELAALKAQQKKIAEQTHLQNKFVEDNEKLKAELAETKKNGENIRKLAIQLKAKFNETSTQLTQSRAQYTELEDKYNALVGESSKQSSLIREIAPKPSLETTQSSVVSTSGTQLLTAEERAGRFKADVQARIQQDDSTTPTPKRKRLHEE
jgi:predicted nuclease with TOPRIM domain